MYDFEFARPTTVEGALKALAEDGAQPLAGGQTIIPTMKSRLASPSSLISVMSIPEMQGVSEESGNLVVGAATPHADVASDAAESFPALAGLAANIGDPAVRSRGTIGGSVANNDPAACYPAAVLACGATIVTNSNSYSADDFFAGLFETALAEDELIVSIRFPIPDAANYQKFEQPASRFALVGSFVAKYGDTVRVAITGASESGVFRWKECEQALQSDFSRSAVEGLAMDSDGLISDLHGPSEYRAHLAKVMTARAVAAAG